MDRAQPAIDFMPEELVLKAAKCNFKKDSAAVASAD